MTMTSSTDDRDELIKELFAEAQGLRMKNEQISQYTESKIAELVKTRRELMQVRGGIEEVVEQRNALQGQLGALTSEHDELVKTRRELMQVRGGIEEVVEQRNALQGQLGALTSEHDQLLQVQVVMTDQRDRLRVRIAEIEASRSYRIGQRFSRLVAKFSASS